MSVTPINRLENAEEHDAVAETIREERMTYPCYLDAQAEWSRATGLREVPSFAVLDRRGRVLYRARGVILEGNEEFAALSAAIERALPAAAAAPSAGAP